MKERTSIPFFLPSHLFFPSSLLLPFLPSFLPLLCLFIPHTFQPPTHPLACLYMHSSMCTPIHTLYAHPNMHLFIHTSIYFFLTGSHYVAGLKLTTYSRLDRDLPLRPKCWDLCFAILQSFFPHTYIYSSLCLPTLFLHTHPFMHASNHSVYINSSLTYLCVPESSHSTIPFTGPF